MSFPSLPTATDAPLEWRLRDHALEYRKLERLIEDNKVQELASYLNALARDKNFVIGPHTFHPTGFDPPTPGPPFDPRRYGNPRLTMQSLLMIACQHPYQSPAVVSLLLSRKYRKMVSPNKCEWYYHQLHSWSCVAPLHVACTGYSQNLALVKTLVKLGADVNIKTACCGETPLHLAVASYGTDEAVRIVKFLLGRGAKINAVDARGNTPLTLLIQRGDSSKKEELADVLLSRRLKPNIVNNVGFGALHYACFNDEEWAVKKLLAKGASPMFDPSDDKRSRVISPVFLTCEEEITRMFTTRFRCPVSCKIDALLMLGAANSGDADKIYRRLWQEAILLRQTHNIFPSSDLSIDGHSEVKTKEDVLEATKDNYSGPSLIQVLLVHERCVGTFGDLSILRMFSYVNTRYFFHRDIRNRYFKRMLNCIRNTAFPHWMLSIETHWQERISGCAGAIDSASRIISRPYGNQERSLEDTERLEEFADICIDLLEAVEYSHNNLLCTRSVSRMKIDNLLWCLVSIFVYWYRAIYRFGYVSDPKVMKPLKDSIQKLVDRNIQFLGTTLLHFFPRIFVKSNHAMDVYELILQSDGVEHYVNHVSVEGYRPLHCVAMNMCKRDVRPYHYDYDEEQDDDVIEIERKVSLILSLVEAGAHLDAVDVKGNTVWDYCAELKQTIPPKPRPLACLAAMVVVRKIPYHMFSFLPPRQKHFVDIHNEACCYDSNDCVAL